MPEVDTNKPNVLGPAKLPQEHAREDPRSRKYQIFVSSTLQDLEEERRAVIEAILMMGHIPVGMELFQAGNDEQWSYIKKRIDQCDYYIVIIAERYGSRTSDDISYTQMEYEYARSNHVPLAAFLLGKTARDNWPKYKCEPEANDKIDEFRKRVETRMVQYWADKNELAVKCMMSIQNLIAEFPRTGWVSGDKAASIQMLSEFSRLSAENDKLRNEISSLISDKNSMKNSENAIGILKNFYIKNSSRNSRRLRSDRIREDVDLRNTTYDVITNISALDAFLINCTALLRGCPTHLFTRNIVKYVEDVKLIEEYIQSGSSGSLEIGIAIQNLSEIFLDELSLRDVIEGQSHWDEDRRVTLWHLTETGKKIANRLSSDIY